MAKALTCHAYCEWRGIERIHLAENYSILTLVFLLGLHREIYTMMLVTQAWVSGSASRGWPRLRGPHAIEIETWKTRYNSSAWSQTLAKTLQWFH